MFLYNYNFLNMKNIKREREKRQNNELSYN